MLGILFIVPAFSQMIQHEDFQSQKKSEGISKYEGSKSIFMDTYVNFDQLIFSEEGIFLETNVGEYFPIRNLTHDGIGYKISGCDGYVCSACGAMYKLKPSSCSRYIQEKGKICGNRTFYERWKT